MFLKFAEKGYKNKISANHCKNFHSFHIWPWKYLKVLHWWCRQQVTRTFTNKTYPTQNAIFRDNVSEIFEFTITKFV